MDEGTYRSWAHYHAAFCGYNPDQLNMTLSWYDVLYLENPDDLHEATRQAMIRGLPMSPRDHLSALLAIIRDLRADRLQAERKPESTGDRPSCSICGDSGWVVVPHPRAMIQGRWEPLAIARGGASWYTASVSCVCARGLSFQQHTRAGRGRDESRPLALAEYEFRFPTWRLEMASVQLRQAEARRLSRQGLPAKPLDSLLSHLANHYGLHGDNP